MPNSRTSFTGARPRSTWSLISRLPFRHDTEWLRRSARMSRKLKAAVAQLGPIHLADSRASVVKRLTALMREAHSAGARFVVFPELALTTFFPRYWMTDQREIDRFFEREMPGA